MGAAGKLKKKVQKEIPKNQDMALGAKMADPSQRQKANPAKIRQVEDITAMFMHLIHGPDTREATLNTLKANPDPAKAVPAAANMLMNRVEQQTIKRKKRLPDDVKVAAAQYMVPDLAMLGNKAQVWDRQVDQSELPQMLQDTMQIYIRKGIKNKSIDPVELQRAAEKLMTPEQKAAAMKMGAATSGGQQLPPGPTPGMAMQQQVDAAVQKEQAKTQQAQAQASALKGQMRQAAAGAHQAQQTEDIAALRGA